METTETMETLVDVDEGCKETREDMLSRHQKEIKELQHTEIQMKKAAAKGSKAEQKAKKKLADEEISKLDSTMKARQAKELASLGFVVEDEKNDSLDTLVKAIAGVTTASTATASNARISKGQKRRDKRAQQDAEREQRIQNEQTSIVSVREVEDKQVEEKLKPLGLCVREIKADGHCLYRAIENQLSLNSNGVQHSYKELRSITADYIRKHSERFSPFIDDDGDDGIENYCREIEKTAAWGGQLELEALSHGLKKHIVVMSGDQADVEMGKEYKDSNNPSLYLSFHRHAFGLGEHYNSLVP